MTEAEKSKNLQAWVDNMPGSNDNPKLHVQGTVMAPSPCHDPYGVYSGNEKANPATYLLTLKFHIRPEACTEVESEREFAYTESKYAGNHGFVKFIFSDSSFIILEIKQVS